jgi:hypothetical protein
MVADSVTYGALARDFGRFVGYRINQLPEPAIKRL